MTHSAGDRVTVRSAEEILATLDERGRLDEMPFMPEMFQYCGQTHRVFRSAHKTCDTVDNSGGRRLEDCVHLDLRCDGSAHGGCDAQCLFFWKTAWLRPVDEAEPGPHAGNGSAPATRCTTDDVERATRARDAEDPDEIIYSCQATTLPEYTQPLPWWDLRQYITDLRTGNVDLGYVARGATYFGFRFVVRHTFWRLSQFLIRSYDRFQALRGGVPYPRHQGRVPAGTKTPDPESVGLLEPGDLVRVRSYDEILDTLNAYNKNRGMFFDAELVPYCGKTFRVKSKVLHFLDEPTGRMIHLKRPAYILEDVFCRSSYSECRFGCPRSIYSWWREIWLEKIESAEASPVEDETSSR
jgi:hypothetical protein